MKSEEIIAIGDRFFNAIEDGRIEDLREIYAAEARIWHNIDLTNKTVDESLPRTARFVTRTTNLRYEKRRYEVFPDGFALQCVISGTRPSGERLTLPSAIFCRVHNGRITRLEEYFDSAALRPWLE